MSDETVAWNESNDYANDVYADGPDDYEREHYFLKDYTEPDPEPEPDEVHPGDEHDVCVSERIDGTWTDCGCEDCEQREYELTEG